VEYWSISEVCKELNISRSTLHQLRKEPSFPLHVSVQRQVRFIADDVRAWKTAMSKKVREENARRLGLIGGAK
jgi:excisionase family DNA binding protein